MKPKRRLTFKTDRTLPRHPNLAHSTITMYKVIYNAFVSKCQDFYKKILESHKNSNKKAPRRAPVVRCFFLILTRIQLLHQLQALLKISTMSSYPFSSANITADCPWLSIRSTLAPFDNKSSTMSLYPARAANIKAVRPDLF